MALLNLSGTIGLTAQNIRPHTALKGSKMRQADLVIDGTITHCIIRRMSRGSIKVLSEQKGHCTVTIYKRSLTRPTFYTKIGCVDVAITIESVGFFAYIHVDHLERFLGAVAMAITRTGLNS